MIRVHATDLLSYTENILLKLGYAPEHAHTVADSLVDANVSGIDTHGVTRLSIYVRRMKMGLINVSPQIKGERTGPATAILDGDNAPGQVVGRAAADEALALAREAGMGLVAAKNSNHFGTAAYFTAYIARQGMIGLALTHSESDVVPYGGRTPFFGTNPLSISLPRQTGEPVVLDMATSIVAMGHVLLAAKEGRTIPDTWAVNVSGDAVTDARQARAVRPMAGAKGYGLAFMIDALSSLLTGATFGTSIKRMYDHFEEPQRIGHVVGAIDVTRFVPLATFQERLEEMIAQIKAIEPAEGFDAVLIPGEPELRTRRQRERAGIPLSSEVYNELSALGSELGVSALKTIEA